MKLFSAPRTRAIRPRWLLEELGVPHEVVQLDLAKGEGRTPEFLALSPLGELPVLVDGNTTLTETLAICLHLADRFPEMRLAPPVDSPERARYLQWMVLAEGSLDAAVMALRAHLLLTAEQQAVAHDALAPQRARLATLLDTIERGLGGSDFLVGEAFSAADLATSSILHLAYNLKLLERHPRLVQYVHVHSARPAVRRALAG